MSRRNPSKKELELSEQAKRKVVEQYGLDVEDYEDLMRMGPPPPGGRMTFDGIPDILGQATYRRSSPAEDAKLREWNKRLSELQARKRKRDEERKRTEEERVQRQADDFAATIRGEETPTQKEARQKVEAAVSPVNQPVQAQTVTPVAQVTLPTGPTSGSGSRRESARPLQRRGVYGGVGKDSSKRNTLEVNNMRLIPSTENRNLVNELQRRQLSDNLNPRLTDSVITNAELRNLQRENGQIALDRARWARRDEILRRGRERSDQISWNRGEVRNARDWEHYGTVASADGWKKGEKSYDDAVATLRDKIKTLQGMADAGYMPSTGKAMSEFSKLIEGSDAGTGLTQKQVEVANKQLDSWLGSAQNRRARVEAGNAYRINQLRNRMGLAEGTSDNDVLAADRAARGKAVSDALEALSDPSVWNGPDYYKHLETVQRNAGPNEGLASSFKAAMRDPATRQRYNDAVTNLTGGSMLSDDEGIADLQNKFAIEHMQAQRSIGLQLPMQQAPAQQNLTDEQKRALGIQAAHGAGDVLRPRRKGVL